MVRCLHQRGESALRKRQRGDQWSGIGGTEPILEDLGGNSELLSFDVHNFSINVSIIAYSSLVVGNQRDGTHIRGAGEQKNFNRSCKMPLDLHILFNLLKK